MSSSARSKDVLIVEDDIIISMVLERMVMKLGHEVIKKEISGQGAIDSVLRFNPELILMDIQLEDDIDGISAMQEIRRKSDVPVIYITGNSDQYYFNRAKTTNFIDYLVKPIQMGHLQESMNKVFSKQYIE